MPSFDTDKPPEIDLIEDCVHCGFCLPTCPTYDAPRGPRCCGAPGLHAGQEEEPLVHPMQLLAQSSECGTRRRRRARLPWR